MPEISKNSTNELDYTKVREAFQEGDWIIGVGEHEGCSQIFDLHTDYPQPFSYLHEDRPEQFRLATFDEMVVAQLNLGSSSA